MASVTTWGDIRLATLQKMFSSDGTSIQTDSSNQEYLYSMPQAANEALQLLSTAGKFLVGETTIVNRPINPMVSVKQNVTIINDIDKVEAVGAKAFYFRVEGKGNVTISVGDNVVQTIEIDSHGKYETHKGIIPNEDKEKVVIAFDAPYKMNRTNLALYDVDYETDEDVDDYEDYLKVNMKDIDEDFYQLHPNELYYESDGAQRYISADKYYQEAGKLLVIPREMVGSYTVYYRKYPQQITLNTEDDYVLSVDPEVAALIPLYMASQLYKDDDNGIATSYRNEFEVGRESLRQSAAVPQLEEFTSAYGWY